MKFLINIDGNPSVQSNNYAIIIILLIYISRDTLWNEYLIYLNIHFVIFVK